MGKRASRGSVYIMTTNLAPTPTSWIFTPLQPSTMRMRDDRLQKVGVSPKIENADLIIWQVRPRLETHKVSPDRNQSHGVSHIAPSISNTSLQSSPLCAPSGNPTITTPRFSHPFPPLWRPVVDDGSWFPPEVTSTVINEPHRHITPLETPVPSPRTAQAGGCAPITPTGKPPLATSLLCTIAGIQLVRV